MYNTLSEFEEPAQNVNTINVWARCRKDFSREGLSCSGQGNVWQVRTGDPRQGRELVDRGQFDV